MKSEKDWVRVFWYENSITFEDEVQRVIKDGCIKYNGSKHKIRNLEKEPNSYYFIVLNPDAYWNNIDNKYAGYSTHHGTLAGGSLVGVKTTHYALDRGLYITRNTKVC